MRSKIRRYRLALAFMIGAVVAASPASADTNLEGRPASWRMQDYLDGAIVLYYTGSSCPSGRLDLPSTAPVETRQRLWSLLLTASESGKAVGVFYDSACRITNFYRIEQ